MEPKNNKTERLINSQARNVCQRLEIELEDLLQLRQRLEDSLRNAPEGSLVSKMSKGKYPQFYLMPEQRGKELSKGKYIRKSEMELAIKLAQKEYDIKMLKALTKQENAIRFFCRNYDENALTDVYDSIPDSRRDLVVPVILPREEYVKSWYGCHPGNRNSMPKNDELQTERGEYVRSKSEKMIADKLYYLNIPYQYEAELRFSEYSVVYPDFTCLNVRTRKTIYWEHMGMMDSADYCKNALKKIDLYEANGIHQGEQLILTMESSLKNINMRQMEALITRYLL